MVATGSIVKFVAGAARFFFVAFGLLVVFPANFACSLIRYLERGEKAYFWKCYLHARS